MADTRDMIAVHNAFRREFGLMPHLVRNVAGGDRLRVARVADHVELVTWLLHAHHMGEDKHIWPLLRERGGENITPIVDLMEEQHITIGAVLVDVRGTLELWRKTATPQMRDDVASAIAGLVGVVNEHLSVEERHVVPLIQKYITEAEWVLVAQEAGAETPPDKLATVFGMVAYEAPSTVVDAIVANMPPDVRPSIRNAARTAYAAYAQELYGTSTPPRIIPAAI